MKVWYVEIIEELYDYIYFIEGAVEQHFGEPRTLSIFHQAKDHQIYLVGTDSDFKDFKTILDAADLKLTYENYDKPYIYYECTKDVLYHFYKYSGIQNDICDTHVLFTFYKNTISKDIVLDKINELGVLSLNDWDKKVLEGEVLRNENS